MQKGNFRELCKFKKFLFREILAGMNVKANIALQSNCSFGSCGIKRHLKG